MNIYTMGIGEGLVGVLGITCFVLGCSQLADDHGVAGIIYLIAAIPFAAGFNALVLRLPSSDEEKRAVEESDRDELGRRR